MDEGRIAQTMVGKSEGDRPLGKTFVRIAGQQNRSL